MKHRYLEVTFRKGKPLAAYLYLPHAAGMRATSTADGGHGTRVDLDDHGVAIGIEITDPSTVSITQLNELLVKYGVTPLESEEWAPLAAA